MNLFDLYTNAIELHYLIINDDEIMCNFNELSFSNYSKLQYVDTSTNITYNTKCNILIALRPTMGMFYTEQYNNCIIVDGRIHIGDPRIEFEYNIADIIRKHTITNILCH